MRGKFISKRAQFERNNEAFKDMVLGHMSQDIDRGIKSTAGTPVEFGQMKSAARHFRAANGQFRVEVDKEYAAVQELGRRAGSAPFKNYTTAGTSAGWFKRAINTVIQHRLNYIEEARRALNL